MLKNEKYQYALPAVCSGNSFTFIGEDLDEIEILQLEISGTGDLRIRNTGGSSSSEGGMGSGSKDTREKGELSKSGEGTEKSTGNSSDKEDSENSFDPVKKDIKEAEKAAGREIKD